MGRTKKGFAAPLLALVLIATCSSCGKPASDRAVETINSFSDIKTWADDTYFFPDAAFRNPDGWKKMSSEERYYTAFVPTEILKSMSTKGLIITCLYYPWFGSLHAFNGYQPGYENLIQSTNCIQELYERDDAGKYLTELYLALDDKIKNREEDLKNETEPVCMYYIEILELILSQEEVLSKFTFEERQLILQKNITMQKNTAYKSICDAMVSLFLAGRIMRMDDADYRQRVGASEEAVKFLEMCDSSYVEAIRLVNETTDGAPRGGAETCP